MKADMIDVRRLIAEVGARNGIRVEPDDPAFALVTLNQLVLEDFITRMDERIRLGIAEFLEAVHKTEAHARKILGAEVRESAAAVREDLQSGTWKLHGLAPSKSSANCIGNTPSWHWSCGARLTSLLRRLSLSASGLVRTCSVEAFTRSPYTGLALSIRNC